MEYAVKARTNRFPPLRQAIGEAVAGHFGEDPIHEEFIQGGHQNSHRWHAGLWLEIVINRRSLRPTFAPTGKRTDVDGGFGIEGNP